SVIFHFLSVILTRLASVSSLFPYTTLFRSQRAGRLRHAVGARRARQPHLDRARRADRDDDLHAQRARSSRGLLRRVQPDRARVRSEEHTSELQSRENLVCRLLLEKKKSI